MADYPETGDAPWGESLKEYIDEPHQDTGWRLIATVAQVGNDIIARRVGPWVSLILDPPWNEGTWHDINVFPVPAGFRPTTLEPGVVMGVEVSGFIVLPEGTYNATGSMAGVGKALYLTENEWPDPLPGTPFTP